MSQTNKWDIILCLSVCHATRSVFYYHVSRPPRPYGFGHFQYFGQGCAAIVRLRKQHPSRDRGTWRSPSRLYSFYGSVCKILTELMRKSLYSSLRDPHDRFLSSRILYHPRGRGRTVRNHADSTDERSDP